MEHEYFLSLHRHWIWANLIKMHFDSRLAHDDIKDPEVFIVQPAGTYMCVWYGVLFAVCEGLREKGIVIPEVQQGIDEIYDSLRLFRNAVFHVQPRYWSDKLHGFVALEGSALKVRRVHEGIGNWFLTELKRRGKEPPAGT